MFDMGFINKTNKEMVCFWHVIDKHDAEAEPIKIYKILFLLQY